MKHVHRNIWRGPRPTDLAEMHGFARIISLQSGVEDRWTDSLIEDQRRRASEFGIEYVNVRCRNWLPPTDAQVREVMGLLWSPLSPAQQIYIHCHSGVDRTGYMCAIFRMQFQCWDFPRAYAEWKAEGRHWWFWWWKPFLYRWRFWRAAA